MSDGNISSEFIGMNGTIPYDGVELDESIQVNIEEDFLDKSSSDLSDLDLSILESLSDIKSGVDNINNSLSLDTDGLSLLRSGNSVSSIDGYYVYSSSRNEVIYIPRDRVQYFSITNNGDLINLSASTIYCYSLDSNGDRLNYYRFQPFGKLEYNYTSGYNSYWAFTDGLASNSNLTFGQVGLSSFSEVLLFLIFCVVGLGFLFKR